MGSFWVGEGSGVVVELFALTAANANEHFVPISSLLWWIIFAWLTVNVREIVEVA